MEGNEILDNFAKRGVGTSCLGLEPFCGRSSIATLKILKIEIEQRKVLRESPSGNQNSSCMFVCCNQSKMINTI